MARSRPRWSGRRSSMPAVEAGDGSDASTSVPPGVSRSWYGRRLSHEGGTMQYALLIYWDESIRDRRTEEEAQATYAEYRKIFETPGVLGGQQLQSVADTTTVRVHNGETLLTDGPFIDAKEHLG